MLYSTLPLIFFVLTTWSTKETTISIDPGSRLVLIGSSNVNKFECICREQFPKTTLEVLDNGGSTLSFSKADLTIQSAALDCGNKIMNKDLFETLKGDQYPTISIKLLKVFAIEQAKKSTVGSSVWLDAEATLSIAGVERQLKLAVKTSKIDNHSYRFSCNKNILMSDFNLIPPKVLLGAVRVNDQISVHLDLKIQIEGA